MDETAMAATADYRGSKACRKNGITFLASRQKVDATRPLYFSTIIVILHIAVFRSAKGKLGAAKRRSYNFGTLSGENPANFPSLY